MTRTSKRTIAGIMLGLCPAIVSADPFAKGNPGIGKQMVEQNCVTCHASSFGGDGSTIYTRETRRVRTSRELIAQIRLCNTNLGLNWFEDEELHVASYLNKSYYKFDK